MTYKELYESAIDKLEKSKITLGEFEKMIEPLNAEVATDIYVGDKDTISRKAAMKACGGYLVPASIIKELPPAQPEIVPCDYAKACNKVAMNRITSAVVYMEILEDFKEYGYVLVDAREVKK